MKLVIVCMYMIVLSKASLMIYFNNETISLNTTASPPFENVPIVFRINASEILLAPINDFVGALEGVFVFVKYVPSIRRLVSWQERGAVAIAVEIPNKDFPVGEHAYFYPALNRSGIKIPFVGIKGISTIFDAVKGRNFSIVMDSENDENPWEELRYHLGFYIFQYSLALLELLVLMYALYKLSLFVRSDEGCTLSVGIFAICLEITSLFLMIITSAVDPFRLRDVYPIMIAEILTTIPYPFTFLSNYLLIFFWLEILNKNNLGVAKFLTTMLPCFIIVCFILFVTEITYSVTRSLYNFGGGEFVSDFNGWYFIIMSLITYVLIYTIIVLACHTTFQRMKKIPKVILKTTTIMALIPILTFTTQIVVYLSSNVASTILEKHYLLFTAVSIVVIISALKISIYNPKKKKKHSSTTKQVSKTK